MKLSAESKTNLTSNLEICKILNGMWQVSGAHGYINKDKAIEAMDNYVDNGFITWDLADHYGPAEDFVKELKIPDDNMPVSEFLKFLGGQLSDDENSILKICAQMDVPIFCPAFTDSGLALQLGFLKGVHPFFILIFLGFLSLILTGIAKKVAPLQYILIKMDEVAKALKDLV